MDNNGMKKRAHVANNSGENEWYTPPKFIDAARRAMGGIDLDPASCALANETVKASIFYTKGDNGLSKNWFGNVWLNPPYSQPEIKLFSDKLVAELPNISQAIILVNNATETKWLNPLLAKCNAACFLLKRVKFINKEGKPIGAPLQGQVVLYFGQNVDSFRNEFLPFGAIAYAALASNQPVAVDEDCLQSIVVECDQATDEDAIATIESIRYMAKRALLALTQAPCASKVFTRDEWLPIETAPKDGTRFDVWAENNYRHTNVEWYEPQQQFVDSISAMEVKFTHWILPPAPPITAKAVQVRE